MFLEVPGNDQPFRIVSFYKHLGTRTSPDNNMSEEVAFRTGVMRSEAGRLKKHVFHSRSLTFSRKLWVMKAYVLSKGTFNCGTWPSLSLTQYKQFHYSIVSMYRDITGQFYSYRHFPVSMFSDDELIHEYGLMCPATILRRAKLLLFYRIVFKNVPVLI